MKKCCFCTKDSKKIPPTRHKNMARIFVPELKRHIPVVTVIRSRKHFSNNCRVKMTRKSGHLIPFGLHEAAIGLACNNDNRSSPLSRFTLATDQYGFFNVYLIACVTLVFPIRLADELVRRSFGMKCSFFILAIERFANYRFQCNTIENILRHWWWHNTFFFASKYATEVAEARVKAYFVRKNESNDVFQSLQRTREIRSYWRRLAPWRMFFFFYTRSLMKVLIKFDVQIHKCV